MPVFKVTRKIRFGQIDAAGIVYYPRLVEMINDVVEDFFAEVIKFNYRQMVVESDFGVPTVSLNVVFKGPIKLEEYVDWHLVLTDIGQASFEVKVIAFVEKIEVLEADVILVYIKGKGDLIKTHPLPEYIREIMSAYLIGE